MIYHIHILSRLGTRLGVKVLECASDEQAVELAKQMPGDRPVEIWCHGRKVARIERPAPD